MESYGGHDGTHGCGCTSRFDRRVADLGDVFYAHLRKARVASESGSLIESLLDIEHLPEFQPV